MAIISNKFINLFYIGLVAPLLFFNDKSTDGIFMNMLFGIVLGLIIIFTGKPKIECSMNNMLKIINWLCVTSMICCILAKNGINIINKTTVKNIGVVIGVFHLIMCILS